MFSPFSLVPGVTPVKDIDGRELTEEDYWALEALLAAEDAASSADAETATTDSLDRDWFELTWLNPPFHRYEVGSWIAKLAIDDPLPGQKDSAFRVVKRLLESFRSHTGKGGL